MSCVMEIDNKGHVVNYDIFPSFIKSRKKMTYAKVNDVIVRNIIDPEYEPFVEKLNQMNELHRILRKEKSNSLYR